MINHTQRNTRDLLMDSPSLRPLVAAVVRDQTQHGRAGLADWLAEHGGPPQVDIDSLTFTEDQVLGDWFPDDPV